MNEKIYYPEKITAGNLKRVYWTFAQDQYGSWANTLTGTYNYSSAEHNVLISLYYYPGGLNQAGQGIVASSRTIERLKSARKIDFTIKGYKVSRNAVNWTNWSGYFCLCNQFIKFDFYKYNFWVVVNGVKKMGLAENTVHNISVRQNCIYVNNEKIEYDNGLLLMNAAGNYCNAYCRMDSTSAGTGVASGAWLYLEVGDLHVTW